MEDEGRRVTRVSQRRYRIAGLIVTIVYLALMLVVALWKLDSLRASELNELGEFVAGFLGPLALFWLILGFWQQGDELRSSVEALMLQSEELRQSVEQQRALVEVTRGQSEAQIEALRYERRAHERSLSPKFTFGGDGGVSSKSLILRHMQIMNLGASCIDVLLKFHSGYEGESRFAAFPSGHSEVIELKFHPDELEENPGNACLKSLYFNLSFSTLSGDFENWTYGVFVLKDSLMVTEQTNTARIFPRNRKEGYPHPDGNHLPPLGNERSDV